MAYDSFAVLTSRGYVITIVKYSGDPEIGQPMGLTESGPISESVRFVKPTNFEWRDTSQFVYRYAVLRVVIEVD